MFSQKYHDSQEQTAYTHTRVSTQKMAGVSTVEIARC